MTFQERGNAEYRYTTRLAYQFLTDKKGLSEHVESNLISHKMHSIHSKAKSHVSEVTTLFKEIFNYYYS